MSASERWLILIIFAPIFGLLVLTTLFGYREWRRKRRANRTNDRINKLD